MPDFVLNRNHVLASLTGHMINFVKGEPTWVPAVCVKEAVAIGAQPIDGPVDVLPPETVEVSTPEGEERKQLVFAAFEDMEAKNVRDDWTASGMPRDKALEKVLGFVIDNKERNALWIEYRALKANG